MSKVVCDVTCSEAAKPDQTRVSITYDVTSLTPERAAFVKELEATYSEFLEDGRQQIITLAAFAPRRVGKAFGYGWSADGTDSPRKGRTRSSCSISARVRGARSCAAAFRRIQLRVRLRRDCV